MSRSPRLNVTEIHHHRPWKSGNNTVKFPDISRFSRQDFTRNNNTDISVLPNGRHFGCSWWWWCDALMSVLIVTALAWRHLQVWSGGVKDCGNVAWCMLWTDALWVCGVVCSCLVGVGGKMALVDRAHQSLRLTQTRNRRSVCLSVCLSVCMYAVVRQWRCLFCLLWESVLAAVPSWLVDVQSTVLMQWTSVKDGHITCCAVRRMVKRCGCHSDHLWTLHS